MIARVDDTVIHESCIVNAGTKLIDAIQKNLWNLKLLLLLFKMV